MCIPSRQIGKFKNAFRRISVEPTLFLFMIAFMITSVVEQQFFVYKSCKVNHQFNETVCQNINQPEFKPQLEIVQVTVTSFLQWYNISSHALTVFLALFMGAWSDKRGRKLPLVIGLCGKFIYSFMIIINALQDSWPVEYIIYTAVLPMTLTGADVIIFAACYSYLVDITTIENRTIRLTILDVAYLFTMPTGVALGKYLFPLVNNSYATMFTINSSILVIAIIYSYINLDWQTNCKQVALSDCGTGFFRDFFDRDHILQTAKTFMKQRNNYKRLHLNLLIVTMILYTFQRDEKQYIFLYVQEKFHWSVDKYSNYRTFQSTLFVIAMLIGVPLMNKIFGLKDSVVCIVGALSNSLARIAFLLANVDWLIYLGAAVSSLGPISGPAIRSMISKTVSQTERGKVMSMLSVADNAAPIISAVIFSQLYIHTFHSSIFLLTILSQILILFIMCGIHFTSNDSTTSEEDPLNLKKTKMINK